VSVPTTDTFFESEIRPTYVTLRDYQLRAVSRIMAEFEAGRRSTLCVMPTGTGKTVTFGYLARVMAAEQGVKTLILAHRGELIQQAADKLGELGLLAGIEKAESRALAFGDPHAVIATVQTMQGRRLATWPRDYFGLIVTDEAHHATADSYGAVYDHFRGVPHLGVTATADRGDKVNLGAVFESVAFEMTLLDAMTATEPGPYLCRLEVVQCDIGIDLRDIRTTAGDLNAADLEEALRPHVEPIANKVKQVVGDRPTIIFTPDVGSAMAIASALESIKLKAHWVSGDDSERDRKVAEYKAGKVQFLVNCNLLTEGFDAPATAAIVLCRPTKSRALYAQMVGRGTRLSPGKQNCLIVDFEWICGRHQLVKPVELLSSRLTADDEDEAALRRRAQAKLDSGQESDLLAAIEQTKRDMEKEAERKALRLSVAERSVNGRTVRYDPLAGYQAVGLPTRFPREIRPMPASEKQVAALRKMGVVVGDDITKKRASMMLDVLCARIDAGKASFKQVNWLIANGVSPAEAHEMSFDGAKEYLSRLWNKGA
jgi:superfamily II DNA or RNA helicase